MEILVCSLGMADYGETLKLQYDLVKARKENKIGNVLLVLEHPPVLTKGTRTDAANIYYSEEQLKEKGISVFEVNRGGDVTYHGPGQVVGYPIVDLHEYGKGIRNFIDTMQESIIDFLECNYDIKAYSQKDKMTGVWVGEEKIAAFGIAVVHGITMHGFAFNVNTNLDHFDLINPCGLSKGVTSVSKLKEEYIDINYAADEIVKSFAKHFDWERTDITIDELQNMIYGRSSDDGR